VAGLDRLYPVEPPASSLWPADGHGDPSPSLPPATHPPSDTLVLAGCDPAAPLLAAELSRSSRVRLLAFTRSSGAALQLLADGLVHLAGLHLGGESGAGHAGLVRERLGPGFGLLRLATWEQGLALAPGLRLATVGSAVSSSLRWVGREPGSGSRQCLDELLGPRRRPRHLAPDHPSVALAIRSGWADAGICPRLPSEEAGLDFLPVRLEAYDLCYPLPLADDPRFLSLLTTLRSASFRSLLSSLPGYSPSSTGDLSPIP
jgi:molybdate-binding protein